MYVCSISRNHYQNLVCCFWQILQHLLTDIVTVDVVCLLVSGEWCIAAVVVLFVVPALSGCRSLSVVKVGVPVCGGGCKIIPTTKSSGKWRFMPFHSYSPLLQHTHAYITTHYTIFTHNQCHHHHKLLPDIHTSYAAAAAAVTDFCSLIRMQLFFCSSTLCFSLSSSWWLTVWRTRCSFFYSLTHTICSRVCMCVCECSSMQK